MSRSDPTLRQVVEQTDALKGFFPPSFYERLQLKLNRSKGSMFEKMAAMVVLSNALEALELTTPEVVLDQKVFLCFEDAPKKRRCDIFLENERIAYEVKSYRPSLTAFIREQIRKDAWLLEQKKVTQVWWILFGGATKRVLEALTQSRIIYLDVSAEAEHFTNIPVVCAGD